MTEPTDAPASALAAIAEDACPAIAAAEQSASNIQSLALQLQFEWQAGPQRQVYEAITRHPHHAECLAAITEDPQLSQFLPDAAGMEPFVMTRSGGSRVTMSILPLAVISAAAAEVFFTGLPLTPQNLREKVLTNVTRIRKGLAEGRVDVVRLVGYGGVPLPADQRIRTPWGDMVAANAPKWLLPESGFNVGMRPGTRPEATAVLVTTSTEPVTVTHEAQPGIPDLEEMRPQIEREQRVATELVPLALILGTAGEDPLRPLPLWNMPILPFSSGRSWSLWMVPYTVRQRSQPISEEEIVEIERWASLLNDHQHDEMAFVGRRIVIAMNARWGLDDVLVDSVIAWENLVGGTPETTFRTSAAMACLLESAPAARLALRHRLARIYDARSDVVHGRLGSDMTKWKWRLAPGTEMVGLDVVSQEAIDYAIRGLKALIETRPDLIPHSAASRCETLLLGA